MKLLWKKYREFVLYCFFGVLTFLVDTGSFFLLEHLFDNMRSNPWLLHGCSVFSTLLAITFAYITNRCYVFRSQASGVSAIGKEMLNFYSARGFTMLIAEIYLHVTVTIFQFAPQYMKLIINIVVIALNYLFSKLWIFRKRDNTEKAEED